MSSNPWPTLATHVRPFPAITKHRPIALVWKTYFEGTRSNDVVALEDSKSITDRDLYWNYQRLSITSSRRRYPWSSLAYPALYPLTPTRLF